MFDARAGLEETERQKVLTLLHDTEQARLRLTAEQRAKVKGPLLAYLKEHQQRIYPIVLKQFEEVAHGETSRPG